MYFTQITAVLISP